MQWHVEYEIGIEALDQQHEELFRHFDRFIEGVVGDKSVAHVLEIMDFLDQYVATHFKREEILMERQNYPGANLHKAQHRLFESEFRKLRLTIDQQGSSYPTEMRLTKVITEWWIDHIQKIDKKLGAFLVDKSPTVSIAG